MVDYIELAAIRCHACNTYMSLRLRELDGLVEGIADVFAWTVALSVKVDRFDSLADTVFEVYANCCKICHDKPCNCGPLGGARFPRV